MGNYELIELLCKVTKMQADIIQKQAEVLAQADIAAEVAAELEAMRDCAAGELARAEKNY